MPDMERRNAYRAVEQERIYQDEKWGGALDHPHSVGGYLTLIRVKLQAAEQAWAGSRGNEPALDEIRKVAALAVACMEQHGAKFREAKPRPELPELLDWIGSR